MYHLPLIFEIYNEKVFKNSLYFVYTQFERFFNFDKPIFLYLKPLESLRFVVFKLNFVLPFLTYFKYLYNFTNRYKCHSYKPKSSKASRKWRTQWINKRPFQFSLKRVMVAVFSWFLCSKPWTLNSGNKRTIRVCCMAHARQFYFITTIKAPTLFYVSRNITSVKLVI